MLIQLTIWMAKQQKYLQFERLNVVGFFVVKRGTTESVYKPSWQGTMGTVTEDLADQAAAAALVTETN